MAALRRLQCPQRDGGIFGNGMGIGRSVVYIEFTSIAKRIARMQGRHSRSICFAALLAALQFGAAAAPAATPDTDDPWPGLVQDIFSNRLMYDAAGVLALEMPFVPTTPRLSRSPCASSFRRPIPAA